MRVDGQKSLNEFLIDVERRALVIAELSTRNREEALDVVQDAMLAFVRRYANKPEQERPPLFYRVLQNKIRDWGRRRMVRDRWRVWFKPEADAEETLDPLQSLPDVRAVLPENAVDNEIAIGKLSKSIEELPFRQRQAVLFRVWEGLSVAETAQVMNCSAGSVKTHLSRGLERLRHLVEVGDG